MTPYPRERLRRFISLLMSHFAGPLSPSDARELEQLRMELSKYDLPRKPGIGSRRKRSRLLWDYSHVSDALRATENDFTAEGD